MCNNMCKGLGPIKVEPPRAKAYTEFKLVTTKIKDCAGMFMPKEKLDLRNERVLKQARKNEEGCHLKMKWPHNFA